MKVQGIIADICATRQGISKNTGKEWTCRTLSLLIPYYTDKGEERFDNILAEYFGDVSDEDLRGYIERQTRFNMTVGLSTRTYEGKRYQSISLYNLSQII